MAKLQNLTGVIVGLLAVAGCGASARADHGPGAGEVKRGASASPATPKVEQRGKAAVAFPHPLITEILYAVPSGDEGDADQSGQRDAIGDEFVEIVNPHDKPIELEGYRLTDGLWNGPSSARKADKSEKGEKGATGDKSGASDKSGERTGERREGSERDDEEADRSSNFGFEFPKLTLEPREVVVVFNGYKSSPAGEVGSAASAPQKNKEFHDAYVFSAGITSKYAAFSNANDMVLLVAPDGEGVQCVRWNNPQATRSQRGRKTDEREEGAGRGEQGTGGDAKPDGEGRNKAPARSTRDKKPGPKHAEVKAQLVETAPKASGSVVRKGGTWIEHVDADTTLFSPGLWEKE